MRITFNKLRGDPALGIEFFWRLALTARRPVSICDHVIPELFYDYLYISRGELTVVDQARPALFALPRQSLKTLHTRPITLKLSTPLVLFGARLALSFAEWYWEPEMGANACVEAGWVRRKPKDLADFAGQLTAYLQAHRTQKHPAPLLAPDLEESGWLAAYSSRHKRRLYQSVFGLSQQALERIRAVHAFLGQTCDFGQQQPRLISHVNPDVFYDQPHLNHAFKRLTGLSPLEYFAANTLLQDHLMAASYNARGGVSG